MTYSEKTSKMETPIGGFQIGNQKIDYNPFTMKDEK